MFGYEKNYCTIIINGKLKFVFPDIWGRNQLLDIGFELGFGFFLLQLIRSDFNLKVFSVFSRVSIKHIQFKDMYIIWKKHQQKKHPQSSPLNKVNCLVTFWVRINYQISVLT